MVAFADDLGQAGAELFDDLQRAIGGGAVNDDMFDVGPALVGHRLQGGTEGGRAVVADGDDGNPQGGMLAHVSVGHQ
jgi:hypothetical protein